jgi:hypothetical protein
MLSLPPLPRPPVRVGFKTGVAVGVVLVSTIRGCAFDVVQFARALDDASPVPVAATNAAPVADDQATSPRAIPTADVEALPRAAVRVEDLPRSRTR